MSIPSSSNRSALVECVIGSQVLVENRLQQPLVHRLHAELLPCLHEAIDLVRLGLANHRLDGGRADQHLRHHHSPAPPVAPDQLLRDHALEREGELRQDLAVSIRGEHVDDAVHRLVGRVRV